MIIRKGSPGRCSGHSLQLTSRNLSIWTLRLLPRCTVATYGCLLHSNWEQLQVLASIFWCILQSDQLFTQLDGVYCTCMWGNPHKTDLCSGAVSDSLFPHHCPPTKSAASSHIISSRILKICQSKVPPFGFPWCISSPITSSASPPQEKAQKKMWQYQVMQHRCISTACRKAEKWKVWL